MPIALSPLVDRAGTILHDANGVPLAADGAGIVYTVHPGGMPAPLGELAEGEDGQVYLTPLGAIDPEDKGHRLIRIGRRRAQLRGRLAAVEGKLSRMQASGGDPRKMQRHLARVEPLRRELAQVQAELDTANAEALNGLGDDDGAEDLAGLGNFKDWWVRNRKIVGGVAGGAAGAALLGAALNPNTSIGRGVRGIPGMLKSAFIGDPPAVDAEPPAPAPPPPPMTQTVMAPPVMMPAAASAGLGGIPTWVLIGGAALAGLMLLKRRH